MAQLYLSRLAGFVWKRHWAVVWISLLLTVVAGFFASKLEFKSNFQDLLPTHFDSIKVLNEVTDKIGGIGYVTLIIFTEDIPKGEKYIAAIGEEIAKIPEIRFVDYRINSEYFKKNSLLYIENEDLNEILHRLEKKRDFEKKVLNPFFINLENEEVDLDFSDILEKYEKQSINANLNGYYVSKDKNKMILLAKPWGLSSDLEYSRKIVKDVKAAVARINPLDFHPSIEVKFTDRYVIMPLENSIIKADIRRTSIVAYIGIILLLSFYTRQKRSIFLIAPPLFMALVWSFGFAYLTIGHVNLVTGFLMAILLGLGIDFGIHIYIRYLHDKRAGLSLEKTIYNMICYTGRSSITAAVTSSAAFFILVFTEFKGFSEFGFIAGFGILFFLISMITVLPSLVIIFEKRYPLSAVANNSNINNNHTAAGKFKFPRSIIIAAIILLILSVANLKSLRFEYNFKNLQVKGLMEAELQDIANETMGISLTPNAILAKDFDEVREITKIIEEYQNEIDKKGGSSTIDKVVSLISSIPDSQDEKLKIISRIQKVYSDKVFKYLRGEQAKTFKEAKEVLYPDRINIDNLPVEVKRIFTGIDNTPTYLMWVFPSVQLYNGKEVIRFVDEIRHINTVKSDPIGVSGETFIIADMLDLIKKDGSLAIILSLITVMIILFIDFRSLPKVGLVMLPLLAGIALMLGVMSLFDIRSNFLNVVMFPTIIGLGVDNGVHLYNRYKEQNYSNVSLMLQSTGSAVILSSLTTIIGFGSLLLAVHQGLNSVGLIAVIGISGCLITSIILFPAVLQFMEDNLTSKASDEVMVEG